ncbi:MAG: Coq4 family protein [Cyanobacteria bacterium P01_A01_bin.84]
MSLLTLPRLNLEFITTLKGCVSLIRDPSQTESVFDIVEGMRNTNASKFALKYIQSHPEVDKIIQERHIPDIPNIEALLKYPQTSLGYTYASYIKESNFQADFYRKLKVKDDISYVLLRMRQSHDIWHIVTGFGTDSIGELGLQAFSLAQTRLPLPVILLAGGLVRTLLKSPETLGNLLEQIAIGYRMGAKAKPFLAQKWEENWNKPLDEIRKELNVELVETYIP